jgi:hypothetical protein
MGKLSTAYDGIIGEWDWVEWLLCFDWTGMMITEWNASRPGTNHNYAFN